MSRLFRTVSPLVLASGSPRRREMLTSLGLEFRVEVADILESVIPGESPCDHVRRLAGEKAAAVAKAAEDTCVLAADTVVVIDGEILGKPGGVAAAVEMLGRLSGRWHEVWTGFALSGGNCSPPVSREVVTRVRFGDLSPEVINAYVNTGEPMDKAGAYGIQGLAASFVREISGSYTNVVGLPLSDVVEEMLAAGIIDPVT